MNKKKKSITGKKVIKLFKRWVVMPVLLLAVISHQPIISSAVSHTQNIKCAVLSNLKSASKVSFKNHKVNFVQKTNAEVCVRIMNNGENLTKVGCLLYNSKENFLDSYYEDCNWNTNYVDYTCNFVKDMGYKLTPGTKYKYILYAVINDKVYTDSIHNFKTTKK